MSAFIYDDQIRSVDDIAPNDRQWSSLIPYIGVLISKLESSLTSSSSSSSNLNPLLGLAYQLKSSINHHIKATQLRRTAQHTRRKEEIEALKKRREATTEDEVELGEINSKFIEMYYPKAIRAYEDLESAFLKGENYLSYSKLDASLPRTYALSNKFQTGYFSSSTTNTSIMEYFDSQNNAVLQDIKDAASSNNTKVSSKIDSLFMKLERDKISTKSFYLPFNPYLDSQQVVAYGYSVAKEWCEKYDVSYNWKL
ncbi:hypothetical protein DASC09_000130 [Saccharomycopsis crataegensis]|uniref:Uncharacterized protein n=1 Tax=Saccharomycopsis crataegensis TaxID=43959 RepID=A0AAV5QD30_9ASCO|nr:hypothetical protein DASC09_000130 [Saccharomycopsis crataegensis]